MIFLHVTAKTTGAGTLVLGWSSLKRAMTIGTSETQSRLLERAKECLFQDK